MRINLSSPLYMTEVEAAVKATHRPKANPLKITHIVTDSREAQRGDLYFALAIDEDKNRIFSKEALSKGALVITEECLPDCITVDDVRTSLLSLASYFKKSRLTKLKHTVAITGSNGKTTTKEILSRMLSKRMRVHATDGNMNNIIGVSLTLLSAPSDTEVLAVEMGMNHEGEISALSRAVEPTLGIITSIGSAHIGLLGSREKIAEAKLELRDGMTDGAILIPYGEGLLAHLERKLTVSTDSAEADIFFDITKEELHSTLFDLYLFGSEYKNLSTELCDRHILTDLAFALGACSLILGENFDPRELLSAVDSRVQRHSILHLHGFSILDDSYNSSLESVRASLKTLTRLGGENIGVLLADVLELGELSRDIHLEIGKAVASVKPKALYIFGKDAHYIQEGAIGAGIEKERIYENLSSDPALTAEQILENHTDGELILFKASRGMHLERVIEILKKG